MDLCFQWDLNVLLLICEQWVCVCAAGRDYFLLGNYCWVRIVIETGILGIIDDLGNVDGFGYKRINTYLTYLIISLTEQKGNKLRKQPSW